MTQVFQKLQEAWILKVCLSCAVTVAIHEHAQIFAAFVALVFADLFSKWLSLSRQRLVDRGEQSPNLWQELCGIRAARHDGYIRSDAMRTRFVHKILSYVVVVASAVVLDFMLTHSHAPAFATTVVIGYLAITEFISILENMQESGVEEAGALVEMIRKRSGVATDKKQEPERRNDK